MPPLTKRATWIGTVLLILGTLVEVLADPTVFAPLAGLLGEPVASKLGAIVAVVGGITAALGRALGEPAETPTESQETP